jgi:MFS family permease
MTISPLGVGGALATGLGNGAFWGLGALYVHNLGYTQADIAMFMSAVIFGGALLQLPIGQQSDNYDRRKVLLVVCVCAMLAAISMLIFATLSFSGLIIGATVYGGFSFAVYSLSVAHTNDHIDATEVMDATSGLLLLNGIGAAIGPVLAGLLMQLFGTGALMFYFASVFGLLALFTFLRMGISTPVPAAEQGDFVPMSRTGTAALEMDPRTEQPETP